MLLPTPFIPHHSAVRLTSLYKRPSQHHQIVSLLVCRLIPPTIAPPAASLPATTTLPFSPMNGNFGFLQIGLFRFWVFHSLYVSRSFSLSLSVIAILCFDAPITRYHGILLLDSSFFFPAPRCFRWVDLAFYLGFFNDFSEYFIMNCPVVVGLVDDSSGVSLVRVGKSLLLTSEMRSRRKDPNLQGCHISQIPQSRRSQVELLKHVDIVCPNESELARLTGMETESFEQIKRAVAKRHQLGVKEVLVLLGGRGSALFTEGKEPIKQSIIEAKKLIDTTGAGDTFNANYAVAFVEGESKVECLKFAAASLCVQVKGAIPSMPRTKAVLHLLQPI